MNKLIAFLILGMGITGAVMIVSVAFLFDPPISTTLKLITLGSLLAFVCFAVSVTILRRRLEQQKR